MDFTAQCLNVLNYHEFDNVILVEYQRHHHDFAGHVANAFEFTLVAKSTKNKLCIDYIKSCNDDNFILHKEIKLNGITVYRFHEHDGDYMDEVYNGSYDEKIKIDGVHDEYWEFIMNKIVGICSKLSVTALLQT